MKIYSVSELTQSIKTNLEERWPELRVEGEISNVHSSQVGHWYFSLKDERTQIRVVMFRNAALNLTFKPEEGLQVIVQGRLSVYEARGEYQIYADQLEPRGIGALQLAFEQLKKKLESEGLFDPARKKSLPTLPQRIGLITSPTGAVVRDMIEILTRRFPNIEILLAPVAVQGREAALEIASAIERMNRQDLDLLIVGRGGGSIEDLWAFNEEVVARAIGASRLPVISAVGHETDFTIADFVADLRAPTPSAAAELAVPVKRELLQMVRERRQQLNSLILTRLETLRLGLKRWSVLLRDPRRRLEELRLRLDSQRDRLYLSVERYREGLEGTIKRLRAHLEALNPLSILERGYAVALTATGKILKDSRQVGPGETVDVRLAHGRLRTRVMDRGRD